MLVTASHNASFEIPLQNLNFPFGPLNSVAREGAMHHVLHGASVQHASNPSPLKTILDTNLVPYTLFSHTTGPFQAAIYFFVICLK